MNNQTATKRKVAAMLKENTGSHFLDSGGAYGRNWQRNQSVKSFDKRPEVTVDIYNDSFDVTVDVYHFLLRAVEYTPDSKKLTRQLMAFSKSPDMADTHWPGCVEGWLDLIGAESHGSHNTYNGDCLLSQTLQFWVFELGNRQYVALQIHGGCDVRGGYTDPTVFELTDDYSIYRYNDLYAVSPPKVAYDPKQTELIQGLPRNESRQFMTDDGYHWYLNGGNQVEFEVKGNKVLFDGQPVQFYA